MNKRELSSNMHYLNHYLHLIYPALHHLPHPWQAHLVHQLDVVVVNPGSPVITLYLHTGFD